MEKISIIIPAYNEEKRIGIMLEEYCKFFMKHRDLNFEFLVVLNGCKDNTIGVVKTAKKKCRHIRIMDFERAGKGFAVVEGFKEALKRKKSLIGFVDADLATRPEEFYKLIENIGDFDGIIASRGLKESTVKTSFKRKITNKGFNFLVRAFLLLPYKDTQCGAKLFRAEALQKIVNYLEETQWAFDIDLLYKLRKNRFRIKEIPTVWEDKAGSTLSLMSVPFQMFSSVIRLRLIYSPFKFIVQTYDKIPEKFKIKIG